MKAENVVEAQTQTPTEALTIQIGEGVSLRVIAEEFYSRYHTEYSYENFKNHREGIWFLMELRDENTKTSVYIIDGEGESKHGFPFGANVGERLRVGMSGAEDYEKGHITCGGWYSIETPYITTNPEDFTITETYEDENGITTVKPIKSLDDFNKDERILLSQLLDRNMLRYLTALIKANHGYIPELHPPYAKYLPLLYTFVSSRTYNLPRDAYMENIPYSFKRAFKFGKIEIYVKKVRFWIEDIDTYVAVNFGDKEGTVIAYGEYAGRKVAYLLKDNSEFAPTCYGWEEYNEHVHPRAEIDLESLARTIQNWGIHALMDIMFTKRLGDVLFLQKDDIKVEGYLQTATSEHIKKIQVINGEIVEDNGKLTLKPKDDNVTEIILYHPEHGILKLEKGEYTLYQVPYFIRGHD